MSVILIIMYLAVALTLLVLAFSIKREYERADKKTTKTLNKQYTGIAIGCAVLFLMASTVFKPQMARIYTEMVKWENPGAFQNLPAASSNTDQLIQTAGNQSAMGLFR